MFCRTNVSGTDPTHYSPYNSVTRGQFSVVDVKTFGWGAESPGSQYFTDVPPSYYAYKYVQIAHNHNIINGYDHNTCAANGKADPCFLPEFTISRDQMAKYISNSANYTDNDVSSLTDFSDVPVGSLFHDYIERLYVHHVTSGANCTPRCYQPSLATTRADISLFVYRGYNQPADGRYANYDRGAAVAYADHWAKNGDDNYYNNTCNPRCYANYGYDHANFVSQAMYDGHLPEILNLGGGLDEWYWRTIYQSSSSWGYNDLGANYLENHFQYWNSRSSRYQVQYSIDRLHNGDIVFFYDNPQHIQQARMVSGFGLSKVRANGGSQKYDLLTDQHKGVYSGHSYYLLPWDDGYNPQTDIVEYWQITY